MRSGKHIIGICLGIAMLMSIAIGHAQRAQVFTQGEKNLKQANLEWATFEKGNLYEHLNLDSSGVREMIVEHVAPAASTDMQVTDSADVVRIKRRHTTYTADGKTTRITEYDPKGRPISDRRLVQEGDVSHLYYFKDREAKEGEFDHPSKHLKKIPLDSGMMLVYRQNVYADSTFDVIKSSLDTFIFNAQDALVYTSHYYAAIEDDKMMFKGATKTTTNKAGNPEKLVVMNNANEPVEEIHFYYDFKDSLIQSGGWSIGETGKKVDHKTYYLRNQQHEIILTHTQLERYRADNSMSYVTIPFKTKLGDSVATGSYVAEFESTRLIKSKDILKNFPNQKGMSDLLTQYLTKKHEAGDGKTQDSTLTGFINKVGFIKWAIANDIKMTYRSDSLQMEHDLDVKLGVERVSYTNPVTGYTYSMKHHPSAQSYEHYHHSVYVNDMASHTDSVPSWVSNQRIKKEMLKKPYVQKSKVYSYQVEEGLLPLLFYRKNKPEGLQHEDTAVVRMSVNDDNGINVMYDEYEITLHF